MHAWVYICRQIFLSEAKCAKANGKTGTLQHVAKLLSLQGGGGLKISLTRACSESVEYYILLQ